MPWFKVDDGLHSHLKARRAVRESPSSMSLWTLAGSWCSDQLTDGWLPDYVAADLMPKTWQKDARALVNARLWVVEERDGEAGWRFHEWNEPGRQPTRESVLAERKAAADRQQRARDRARESRPQSRRDDTRDERRDSRVSHRGSNGPPDPTRPDLYRGDSPTGSYDRAPAGSQPLRCEKHKDDPNPPPCGACAAARRAAEDQAADRRQRLADAPQCRTHRGQPAHNCALCRADALAAPDLAEAP